METPRSWLIQKIAEETGLHPDQISTTDNFETFGFDSLATISLTYEMETTYGLDEVNPTVFTEYNSIEKLAEWLQQQV